MTNLTSSTFTLTNIDVSIRVPLPLLVKFQTAKFPVLSNYRNLFIRMEQTLIDFIKPIPPAKL